MLISHGLVQLGFNNWYPIFKYKRFKNSQNILIMEKLSKFYEIRYWFGKKKKFIEEFIFSTLLSINKKTLKNDSLTKVLNLKNIHKNKRCFIVGNGPSLNKMELDLLKNDFCFIFNGAFSLRKKINKEKIFHVIEDNLFLQIIWKQSTNLMDNCF